jgi:hypothetical protein
MAKPAPRCNTNNKSDAMHHLNNVGTAISANLNLTSISGKPRWAPQKTTIWADAADQTIVLIDEKDVTHTITAPSTGNPVVITRPMKTLVDSGSTDVNVIFDWFDPNGSLEWNP